MRLKHLASFHWNRTFIQISINCLIGSEMLNRLKRDCSKCFYVVHCTSKWSCAYSVFVRVTDKRRWCFLVSHRRFAARRTWIFRHHIRPIDTSLGSGFYVLFCLLVPTSLQSFQVSLTSIQKRSADICGNNSVKSQRIFKSLSLTDSSGNL